MRPTTMQHLRFLEHSLTPHDVLLLERRARRAPAGCATIRSTSCCSTTRCSACAGRRRSSAGDRASTGSGTATPCASRCRRTSTSAPHTLDEWLGEPRPRTACSRCSTGATGPCCIPDESRADPDGAVVHRLRRRSRGRRGGARCPAPHAERDVDIVYRARNLPYHVGHHGQLKHEIAQIVEPAARAHGLRTDISTDIGDTKYGDAWFEFLASGRCVIGTESGSSALDPVGAHAAVRGRVAAVAPGRDLRGVLGAAASRAGTTTTSRPSVRACSRPRRRRPRSSSSRASTTGSSSPRRTMCRCARTCRTSTRRWSGSPTRPRPRPSPSARGRT